MVDEEITASAPLEQGNWVSQAIPALLVAAVLGLAGLFLQVTKLEAGVSAVLEDVRELKNDSKERLNDMDRRLRTVEMAMPRQIR